MKFTFIGRARRTSLKVGICLFLLMAFAATSCKSKPGSGSITNVSPPCDNGTLSPDTLVWADYNIVFKPNTTQSDRDGYLYQFETYLCDVLSRKYTGARRIYHEFCPCGPAFVNVKVVIDESGGSVTGAPPPPGSPPGVSGGNVEYIGMNTKVRIPELHQGIAADTSNRYNVLDATKKVGQTIVAVIDTGLDTLMYNTTASNLANWIWHDPSGTSTFNFVGGNSSDFRDKSAERHGTLVTAMVLDMFRDTTVFPRLMILKALDDNGSGTIFSVTCAISYAICHNATVINASWGYYGAPDPTLLQCILQSDSANIPVIAAAGNVDPTHSNTLFCSTNNPPDSLGQNHLFYPGCFADTMGLKNLISVANVAGLNGVPAGACFYQNHSSKYVSTGVLNTRTNDCCQYNNIPFLAQGSATAEGSSFGTPVVSGQIDRFIEGGGAFVNGKDWLRIHSQTPNAILMQCCTINGQYVLYSGSF